MQTCAGQRKDDLMRMGMPPDYEHQQKGDEDGHHGDDDRTWTTTTTAGVLTLTRSPQPDIIFPHLVNIVVSSFLSVPTSATQHEYAHFLYYPAHCVIGNGRHANALERASLCVSSCARRAGIRGSSTYSQRPSSIFHPTLIPQQWSLPFFTSFLLLVGFLCSREAVHVC